MTKQSDTTDLINGLVSLFASEGISKTRRGVTARVTNHFVQIAALMGLINTCQDLTLLSRCAKRKPRILLAEY